MPNVFSCGAISNLEAFRVVLMSVFSFFVYN